MKDGMKHRYMMNMAKETISFVSIWYPANIDRWLRIDG